MHQTTVRFGPDLWDAVELECARLGVSAAQYLREAALARLSYSAGRRGEDDYEEALVGAGAEATMTQAGIRVPVVVPGVTAAQQESTEQRDAASAVTAQSELVWRRAREVRAHSAELRRWRKETGWR
jgi:hypothetical protein